MNSFLIADAPGAEAARRREVKPAHHAAMILITPVRKPEQHCRLPLQTKTTPAVVPIIFSQAKIQQEE
jgi:hypothetical protein